MKTKKGAARTVVSSLLGITFRVPSGGSPIFVILRMVLIIYT